MCVPQTDCIERQLGCHIVLHKSSGWVRVIFAAFLFLNNQRDKMSLVFFRGRGANVSPSAASAGRRWACLDMLLAGDTVADGRTSLKPNLCFASDKWCHSAKLIAPSSQSKLISAAFRRWLCPLRRIWSVYMRFIPRGFCIIVVTLYGAEPLVLF